MKRTRKKEISRKKKRKKKNMYIYGRCVSKRGKQSAITCVAAAHTHLCAALRCISSPVGCFPYAIRIRR